MSIESKLKALKVPELKAIITASEVSVTSKANKGDLIAAIVASQKAVSTYYALHDPEGQSESHAAEPEEAPAQAEPVVPAPSKEDVPAQATPVEAKKPASTNANKTDASAEPSKTDAVVDVELEKRKARAARFQIPLVEKVPTSTTGGKGRQRKAAEDSEKLAARAARFNLAKSTAPAKGKKDSQSEEKTNTRAPRSQTVPTKRKQPVVEEVVDAEEAERRKKRAERFKTA